MSKLDEWLKKEREMLDGVTEGPWKWRKTPINEEDNFYESLRSKSKKEDKYKDIITTECGYLGPYGSDAEFIAHVRTSHEQALKVIEKMREALLFYNSDWNDDIFVFRDGNKHVVHYSNNKLTTDGGCKAFEALSIEPEKL